MFGARYLCNQATFPMEGGPVRLAKDPSLSFESIPGRSDQLFIDNLVIKSPSIAIKNAFPKWRRTQGLKLAVPGCLTPASMWICVKGGNNQTQWSGAASKKKKLCLLKPHLHALHILHTHTRYMAVAAEGAEACCLLTHTVSVCCSQQPSEPYVNTYDTRTSSDYLLCVCIRIPVTKRKKKKKKNSLYFIHWQLFS